MSNYDQYVEEAAQNYGIPVSLLKSLIQTESSWNPYAVSPAGAQGLMQIMPATGAEWAAKTGYNNYNAFDPKMNIDVGANYLSYLMNKYKDPNLAVAAYNAGPGTLDAAIGKANSSDYSVVSQYLPQETVDHNQKVTGFDQIKDYGLNKAKNYALDKAYDYAIGGGTAGATTGAYTGADGAIYNAAGEYIGVDPSLEVATGLDGSVLTAGDKVIAAPPSLASQGLGALGVAYGGYNAFQGIKNKNPVQAGLGGTSAVLGLNALGYTLGPWGVAATIAAPAAISWLSSLGDKDRWKEEQDAVGKLADSGVTGWREFQSTLPHLTKGRSKNELIDIERQKAAQGLYSNEDFARTRDEKYLKPQDIWGYSVFGNKFGNDWFGKYSEDQRYNIAQAALDANAVKEGKGQMAIDWSKIDQNYLDSLINGGQTKSKTILPLNDSNWTAPASPGSYGAGPQLPPGPTWTQGQGWNFLPPSPSDAGMIKAPDGINWMDPKTGYQTLMGGPPSNGSTIGNSVAGFLASRGTPASRMGSAMGMPATQAPMGTAPAQRLGSAMQEDEKKKAMPVQKWRPAYLPWGNR